MWSPDDFIGEIENFLDVKNEYNNISTINDAIDNTTQPSEEPRLSTNDDQHYTLTNLTSNEDLETNAEPQSNPSVHINWSEYLTSERLIEVDVLENKEIHSINNGSKYEEVTSKFSLPQTSIGTGRLIIFIS